MAQIQKFSLSYDPAEDRLVWDAEDKEGSTLRMWMTQRLCKAMVEATTPMVVKASARGGEAAVQSWEQAAAMAELGKSTPVRPQPQQLTGLIKTVNMRQSGADLVLTFDFGAPSPCTMGLKLHELRQMLAVLHRLYVSAGWPLDIWPQWIAQPEAAIATATGVVN
jgi:hypothetical protein